MLGYVHLTAGRPVLERRAAAGMTYWALEGDLDGGLFPGRRLRRWIGRLERCGVSHAALPPGREGNFAPLRPVLPDGLRLALLPQLLDALAPAGDTALLLADCADSRALLAAQVLARRFRRLRLETGRTHQIRVHLQSLGCPIAGDYLYGEPLPQLAGRFALHAARMQLTHPMTGETLTFESPLPEALAALLKE